MRDYRHAARVVLTCLVVPYSIFGAAYWMATRYLDRPEVEYSSMTGQCVRVVAPGSTYDCEHLPSMFELVWIK